jgi:hypothetical protein
VRFECCELSKVIPRDQRRPFSVCRKANCSGSHSILLLSSYSEALKYPYPCSSRQMSGEYD